VIEADVCIRPAAQADAAGMLQILNPIIRHGGLTSMTTELTVQQQQRFVETFPTGGNLLVAEAVGSGQLLGMQDLQPQTDGSSAAISTFVRLDHHRVGIGRRLMQRSLQFASGRFQTLIAEVRCCNPTAIAFYQRFDFRADDCSAAPSTDPAEIVRLTRRVLQTEER
jgi:ribosomal protein S18 acetylase RimI-like enzyme